jgi:hypothetical protein
VGAVDVVVTNPDTQSGTLASGYTYTSACVVSLTGSWDTGLTHVAPAGTDRTLVFIAGNEPQTTPNITLDSLTYGGQTMTKINEVSVGTGPIAYVTMWYLDEGGIAAATGSTFVPTWSGTPATVLYSHAFFEGVDQPTTIGAQDTNSSNAETPNPLTISPALSTNIGDMVVVGAESGEDFGYTPQNGFTEGNDQSSTAGGGSASLGTAYKPATGASETPSMLAGLPFNRQVIAAVVLPIAAQTRAGPRSPLPARASTAASPTSPSAGQRPRA